MSQELVTTVSRYYHTIKFLKLAQVVNRVLKPFRPLDVTPCGGLTRRSQERPFEIGGLNPQSVFDDERVIFLNESGVIGDWNDVSRSRLWLYNLHYFNDLDSNCSGTRVDIHKSLLARWIDENPPGKGAGWEAYPTSLRIVNWIKWFLSTGIEDRRFLSSLSLQAKVLYQTLETHLLGNHLFANAKALLFAGLFFEGRQADLWTTEALSILDREIDEQILPDGGNFELSVMYHSIITADMLDLINLLSAYQIPSLEQRLTHFRKVATKMLAWLTTMVHPDGQISFFNDSALGVAPSLDNLRNYALRLGLESRTCSQNRELTHLPDSGYIRLSLDEAVALIDVAEVGPDYIPGHAHADTLSFELSVFGERLIVNSGTSCYEESVERHRQRGTASHSTVVINDHDSSEVWGSFRVARRARPIALRIDELNQEIACGHSGYTRLKGCPVHHRSWQYRARRLLIKDSVKGPFESAKAYFHIHPDWQLEFKDNTLRCVKGDKEVNVLLSGGVGSLEDTTYHEAFGSSRESRALVVRFTSSEIETRLRW